jgi:carbonic anhydrase
MVADWIKENFGEGDLVAMPGASKAVLEEPAAVKSIRTLVDLHHAKKIVVVDHMDCGAYGGSKRFDWDHAAEVSLHGQKLADAKQDLKKHFPILDIEIYLLGAEGELGQIGSQLDG